MPRVIPRIPPSLVERAKQLVNPNAAPAPVVDPEERSRREQEEAALEEAERRADEDAVRATLEYLMPRTKERTVERVTVYALCKRYGMHPRVPTRAQAIARAQHRVRIATAIARLNAEGDVLVQQDGTLILSDHCYAKE